MDEPVPTAPAAPDGAPTGPPPPAAPPQLKLDFASGGWVLLVAGLLGLYLLLHLTWPLLTGRVKPQQEVSTPEALGFDLSNCRVDRSLIAYGTQPDSIPPLVMPKTVPGSAVEALNKAYRRKYHHKFVVTGDRVVGMTLGGESRAYQLKLLQWHEVVNDVLGGVPIAVTYSPLCDSVVVFDRRVAGELVVLASSGQLYNSNSLLYEQRLAFPNIGQSFKEGPQLSAEEAEQRLYAQVDGKWSPAGASLWSQLGRSAISGWAAGQELKPLPCEVTHWGSWLARQPDTTLLSDETGFNRQYTQNAYGAYYDRAKLRFPVRPELPGDATSGFGRGLAVLHAGGWQAVGLETLAAASQPANLPAEAAAALDPGGRPDPARAPLRADAAGRRFIYEPVQSGMEPATARLEDNPAGEPVVYGLWFALYAFGYAN